MTMEEMKVTFERELLGATKQLTQLFAMHCATEVEIRYQCQHLVAVVMQAVAAQTLDSVEHSYPADWWQAVKARFAPQWFLQRWPTRMIRVRLEAKVLYPKIALPDEPHVMRFTKVFP